MKNSLQRGNIVDRVEWPEVLDLSNHRMLNIGGSSQTGRFQDSRPQLSTRLTQEAEEEPLVGASIRRKRAFDCLCENNAVTHDPVKGMQRPVWNRSRENPGAGGNFQAHLTRPI